MPKSRAYAQRNKTSANRMPQRSINARANCRIKGKKTNETRAILEDIWENAPNEGHLIYDYLMAACAERGINANELIRTLRDIGVHTQRWEKATPDTSADNGAFHMWLEVDGKPLDPEFPEYEGLCKMPNCDPEQRVYHKWSKEKQAEKLRNLIPGIMKVIKDNCDINGLSKKEMMAVLALNPQFRCCPMNTWCLKHFKPDGEICIGNMGFRSKDDPDRIWWEY